MAGVSEEENIKSAIVILGQKWVTHPWRHWMMWAPGKAEGKDGSTHDHPEGGYGLASNGGYWGTPCEKRG
jgi:hypothetical protein